MKGFDTLDWIVKKTAALQNIFEGTKRETARLLLNLLNEGEYHDDLSEALTLDCIAYLTSCLTSGSRNLIVDEADS